MGHLTQSVSTDDVYKLNISYRYIKKWHRRHLRWDPSSLTYSLYASQNGLSAGRVENIELVEYFIKVIESGTGVASCRTFDMLFFVIGHVCSSHFILLIEQ